MKAMNKKNALGRSQNRFVLMALAPIMLFFLIFSIFPIIANLFISMFNYNPFGKSPFVFLNNYVSLPSLDGFSRTMVNTFVFTFTTAAINIVLATIVALSINSLRSRTIKNSVRTVLFTPVVLPIVAVSYVWSAMFDSQSGIINSILTMFGMKHPIFWLMDPHYAMPALILVTLWVDLGYNLVLILAGLESIPKTFTEAARIDGANGFQFFWKITLPLMTRTMLFVSIMTVISYFQVFGQIQIMTQGGPDYATQVLSYSIYQYAFVFQTMGTASAMSVLLMVIILGVSALQLFLGKVDWES